MEERYKFYFLDGPFDAKKMEINVQAGFIFVIRREVVWENRKSFLKKKSYERRILLFAYGGDKKVS